MKNDERKETLREKHPNTESYFPVFGLNTEKYEPEKTVCLDTFNAAKVVIHMNHLRLN